MLLMILLTMLLTTLLTTLVASRFAAGKRKSLFSFAPNKYSLYKYSFYKYCLYSHTVRKRFNDVPATVTRLMWVSLLLIQFSFSPSALCQDVNTRNDFILALDSSSETFNFDIPAQPLANALILFNQITNVPVIYNGNLSIDETTAPIIGVYTAKQALNLMLEDTDLDYHQSLSGVLTLVSQQKQITQDDELVITAHRLPFNEYTNNLSFYGDIESSSAKLPQGIQTIDKQTIEHFGASSIDEALEHVSGIEYLGSINGITNDLALRGFISPAIAVDGLSHPSPGLLPEMSSIEKIEVIKGPPSVLYGSFKPGGVINVINKKPRLTPHKEVSITSDSYESIKTAIDIGGPLDSLAWNNLSGSSQNEFAYRLNASLEKKRNFRDFVEYQTYTFAPYLSMYGADGSTLSLRSDAQFKQGGVDTFLFSENEFSDIGDIPDERNYGEDWDKSNLDYQSHVLSFNKPINLEHLSLTLHNRKQTFSSEFVTIFEPRKMGNPGEVVRGATGINQEIESNNIDIHYQWQWQINRWRFKNTLGGDYREYDLKASIKIPIGAWEAVKNISFDRLSEAIDYFDPFDPIYDFDKPELVTAAAYLEKTKVHSFYFQSFIESAEKWAFLTGIRNDYFSPDSQVIDYTFGLGPFDPNPGIKSTGYHLGTNYTFSNKLSLYVNTSHSNHFNIERYETKQWEFGFKARQLLDKYDVDITFFALDQLNQINQDFLTVAILGSSVPPHYSQGVEWDVSAWITPHIRIQNSSSLINAKLHSFWVDDVNVMGLRPSHQANELTSLWLSYFPSGINQGFNFNIGLRYVGERYANELNTERLDGYSRVDANISYQSHPRGSSKGFKTNTNKYRVSLKIENVFNARYNKGSAAQLFEFSGLTIPKLDDEFNDFINQISNQYLNAGGVVPGNPLTITAAFSLTF